MKAKQLAKIMKALSNENRLNLYMEIAKHEESNFETQECNISDIVKLDTSLTTLQEVNLNVLVGGIIRSVTVLDVGGGLYLQTSIGDPFEVLKGDMINNEELEILRWKGTGAGTGIIRITGLRI